MNFNVMYRPSGAMAQVQLEGGEQLLAEAGAMIGMSPNMNMETQAKGGVGAGLKRMFSGESFFQNTFTAMNGPGEVLVAHSLPGDIVSIEVPQSALMIQSSSFIASHMGVTTSAKVGGFKTFFAGEGLFALRSEASGPGQQVLVGAFGGITEMQCDGNLVIDTGHLVAWDAGLTYKTQKSASGWLASFLSGEGLVCQFEGQGRVWIQSRNPREYGTLIGRQLPPA